MALSESVENSLREAEASLRNSLAFSARNEKPYVSAIIAEMLSKIDNLIQFDKFSDRLEEKMKNSNNDFYKDFF